MKTIAVIGGGAAGMLAAISAAESGARVILLEKNEKTGKKLYITGKGRCNVTNACDDTQLFLEHIRHNPYFMYSALYAFTNLDMMEYLERCGLRLKVERGQRVFQASDKSSDVIRTLQAQLAEYGVDVRLHTAVRHLLIEDGRAAGVRTERGDTIKADAVIIACGGLSYPSTGSTGDGYRLAEEAGHSVTSLTPSLVPLIVRETYCSQLMGLSLKNVTLTLQDSRKKKFYEGFGEMMFTHFGITGPIVLTASTYIQKPLKSGPVSGAINLKPALTPVQLDKRLQRDFEKNINRNIGNSLGALLPASLIPVILALSEIDPQKKVHEITRQERHRLAGCIQGMPLTVTGTADFSQAIITQGGINVKEIDSSTMESRLVRGLYFAGEVLDVDAETGGYNLQIAWSTGRLAGLSAAQEE